MTRTLVMAHGDGDGVVSASLIKHVRPRARVFFSHPVGLLGDLREQEDFEELFILDIALNERHKDEIVSELNALVSEGIKVHYVDHHPWPELGVEPEFEVIHELGVSASELTFRVFVGKGDMDRVALYGAIVDYMDLTPWATQALGMWDKREIYFEAGILALGLEGTRKMYEKKREVVEALSRNGRPSSIQWLRERALEEAGRNEELREWVARNVREYGPISLVEDPPGSLGHGATYAMRYGKGKVGMAVQHLDGKATASLRSREVDLNRILRSVSRRLNVHGGGHPHAAGLRFDSSLFWTLIKELSTEILRK